MDWARIPLPGRKPGTRVIVIGAGVVGVATAYALARRGHTVTLIDAAAGPGTVASFANGAQLSFAYTDPLATPALLRHLPALALGLDPAFRLALSPDPGLLRWLLRFLRQMTPGRADANMRAALALGLESRAALHALLARHALDFGHAAPGKLLVYDDAATLTRAERGAAVKRALGADWHRLSPHDAVALEPALAQRTRPIAGALFCASEELGDPHRFCVALTDLITRDYGVHPRWQTRVTAVDTSDLQSACVLATGERLGADHIILCAGMASADLLRPFGLGSALAPMKGYSLTAPLGAAPPRISITDVARKLVFCPLAGTMRIAGLADLGARGDAIDPARAAELEVSARAAFPDAADYRAISHRWAGVRPMTADSLPLIRTIAPGVTINIGHGMLGWTFAMGSAERVAALLSPTDADKEMTG